MFKRRLQNGLLALAVALACHAGSAHAQDDASVQEQLPATVSAAREVYTAADFARFAPRNVLDLIRQIPGFDLDDSNDSGRGFGQASENLLINGQRVSRKSTSTASRLARLPVGNVVRIEVVDGAMLDIPGLSGRVANIIVQQGGPSGQFRWRPEWNTLIAPAQWFEGEVSLTGELGGVNYTLALANQDSASGRFGPSLVTDANGLVDARVNSSSHLFNRPNLSGFFGFEPAPLIQVNLNLTGEIEIFDSEEQKFRNAGSQLPLFVERFDTDSDEWFYEFGGDISFPVGAGQLKLIALESFRHRERISSSLVDTAGLPTSGSQFNRVADQGERIGRGEYSWAMWGADWQISAEAAFNRLDQVGRLFAFDAALGDYAEVDFPGGAGGVREDRYEALLSVGLPITDRLSVQLVGGGEYSQIAQTGANARSRTFERPKGSLGLAWAPVDGLDINLEVARRVGQLDFGDFLASVSLSEDQTNAGNNDLRPQQNWDIKLEVAKKFGAFGSATLTLFDEQIEDLVLILPIAAGGEARGNIASARRTGAVLIGTLQFAPLGLEGAQLDIKIESEDSDLIDPVTLLARRFDGNDPFEISLDFRHDVPHTNWAYGWFFQDTERAPRFRVGQEILEFGPSTFGAVFVEHKDVFGATANLRLGNIFDGGDTLLRTVYDGPRDSSPILFTEERRRDRGQSITLTLTGSF